MTNIRLIDANALKVALDKCGKEPDYQHEGEDWRNGICIAETIIDNAPTVEPEKAKEGELVKAYTKGFDAGVETARPQGEWITRHKQNSFGQDVVCFECNKCGEYKLPIIYTMITEPLGVCPNCGARMKGGAE